jgi:hypothetical protein
VVMLMIGHGLQASFQIHRAVMAAITRFRCRTLLRFALSQAPALPPAMGIRPAA